MDDFLVELKTLTDDCREIAGAHRSGDLASSCKSLRKVIASIHDSWSGSPLGRHAWIYLEDFRPREAGEYFDSEWGTIHSRLNTTTGPWCEYSSQEVEDEILARYQGVKLSEIENLADTARDAFEKCKAELLPTLDAWIDANGSAALQGLRKEAAALDSCVSKAQYLSQLVPAGPFVSRDSAALSRGIQAPPHLERLAWLLEKESCFHQCGELANVSKRAKRYLGRRALLGSKLSRGMSGDTHRKREPKQTAAGTPSRTRPSVLVMAFVGGIVALGIAVLGNLVAAWIQQDLLRNVFTLERVVLILLLTFLGVLAAVWIDRRIQGNSEKDVELAGASPIELTVQNIQFGGGGWEGAMPLLPLKFRLFLDLRNRGSESAIIRSIEITEFDMGTALIGGQPTKVTWSMRDGDTWRKFNWPLALEQREWKPQAMCEIEVELTEKDPKRFATRLDELKDYRMVLRCSYEELTGQSEEKGYLVRGSFSSFKDGVKMEWKKRRYDDLVSAVEDY